MRKLKQVMNWEVETEPDDFKRVKLLKIDELKRFNEILAIN